MNPLREQRFAAGVGSLLIACGILFNEWTIGRTLSPDGEIDSAVFRASIGMIELFGILAGILIIRHPRYARGPASALVFGGSLLLTSLIFFAVLEFCPALIRVLPLSGIHYYALHGAYIVDDELVLRNRPSSTFSISQFKGELYHPSYAEPVPGIL